MGYGKCAVPGCLSRPGQGKIFKYLPKPESQRKAWIQAVPRCVLIDCSKENASRQIAFCEDHFKAQDFEEGAYGKRRLNSTAIPSLFGPSHVCSPPPRKALGDMTNNVLAAVNVQASPPRQRVTACLQKTAVSGTQTHQMFGSPVEENVFEDCGLGASLVMKVEAEEDYLITTDILDEKTGNFIANTSDMQNPIDHDQVYVCELTGNIRPLSPEAQMELSIDSLADQQSILLSFVDALEDTVSKQAATIAQLQEENQAKDNVLAEHKKKLSEMDDGLGVFSRKCKALNRSTQRAKKKIDEFGSKWLTPDQARRLARKSRRGVKWTSEEIRVGLILKMKSGTSAYKDWVSRYPLLPSVRSLQKAVQFIRFGPGLLHGMFDLLEELTAKLPDKEKDCQIVLDEMLIEEGRKYDASLKTMVGDATLKTHSGIAKRALVFILAGISRRWKIAVAVEFTNHKDPAAKSCKSNLTGEAYKNIIDSIVKLAEEKGLYVCSITSDMGPDNLAFWRAYGIASTRKGEVKNFFPNPARPGVNVTVIPDAVHLWKGIKTMLESNRTVTLPASVVKEEGLLSPVVDYAHIEDLLEFESGNELKVAFRLKEENVHCKKHFHKMNVGITTAVLGHRTGVGLKMLSEEKRDPSYLTTAWFVIFLNTFFTLATCRYKALAISKVNPVAYSRFVNLIQRMAYIFENMSVGASGVFKPVQRGMRVLCAGYLNLIHYFLEVRGYKYLMLGRFTGDCIENLFSLVRFTQPIPSASMFLHALKVITLAQFSQAIKGSSYNHEQSSPLSEDFLEKAREKATQRAHQQFFLSLEELMQHQIDLLTEADYALLGDFERSVVYDMAGSVVAAILRSNQKVCDQCLSAVKWQNKEELHPASVVTEMKEFTLLRSEERKKMKLQIYVSEAVFKAILTAEITFRLHREASIKFKSTDVKQYFVENLMSVWNGSGIPECHFIGRKILQTFFDFRFKQHSKAVKEKLEKCEASKRSSKSAAMRQAANNMTSFTVVK